jgi:saccharopine dehydrogenase-like NADP-dependent oxidoreductase
LKYPFRRNGEMMASRLASSTSRNATCSSHERAPYNLTWSTEGLINEYCNPCEAIVDGRDVQVPPLEEVDRFSLDGVAYEAFHGGEIQGRQLSAGQLTTAAGVCAMVDLLLAGRLPQRGFVRQEEARLDEFLANRFGRYLA